MLRPACQRCHPPESFASAPRRRPAGRGGVCATRVAMSSSTPPTREPRSIRLTVPDGNEGASLAPAAGVSLAALGVGYQTGSGWIFWGALLALGFVLYRAGRSTVVTVDGAARALRVTERVWFRGVSERVVPIGALEDVVVEEEYKRVPDPESGEVLVRVLRVSARRRRDPPVLIALPSDLPRARAESFVLRIHEALYDAAGFERASDAPRGAAYRQRARPEREGP